MEGLELDRWNVDFDTSKSIRYHAYRRSFWSAIDNWTKILTVISGTAVFVSVLSGSPSLTMAFAIFVAVSGAADLVLGFCDKMRMHDGLYRRFSLLAQDIAENTNPTNAQISLWRRRRLEIEMDEPGTLDWLERRCSAEEAKARGCPIDPAWKLSGWQVALSQFAMWPSIPRT